MNYMTIGILVMVLLSGGIIGSKIGKLNPFSSRNKVYVEKSQSSRVEYYKDKIKGVEYRVEERSQNKTPISQKTTRGDRIGNFIDNAWDLILWYFVIGIAGIIFFHWNLFSWTRKKLQELNMYRKSLKQTSKGIQIAKKEMNGEAQKFLDTLDKTQDDDVKIFIRKLKDENNIK